MDPSQLVPDPLLEDFGEEPSIDYGATAKTLAESYERLTAMVAVDKVVRDEEGEYSTPVQEKESWADASELSDVKPEPDLVPHEIDLAGSVGEDSSADDLVKSKGKRVELAEPEMSSPFSRHASSREKWGAASKLAVKTEGIKLEVSDQSDAAPSQMFATKPPATPALSKMPATPTPQTPVSDSAKKIKALTAEVDTLRRLLEAVQTENVLTKTRLTRMEELLDRAESRTLDVLNRMNDFDHNSLSVVNQAAKVIADLGTTKESAELVPKLQAVSEATSAAIVSRPAETLNAIPAQRRKKGPFNFSAY